MHNIKFSYLYRDSANYKKFGAIIFDNIMDIDITGLQNLIQCNLVDGTWFYASKWQVSDLHFNAWIDEFDHTFHEFECIEYTFEPPNSLLTLAEFKTLIERTNWA